MEGSPEDEEIQFPQRQPALVTPCHSNNSSALASATATAGANAEGAPGDEAGAMRGSSAGERVSTDFEKSAMTAAASVRLLASQVTLELSSYPGGPAFMASTSHVFMRAVTWPSDYNRGRGRGDGAVQVGPEVFARLSRVSCRVKCADGLRAPAPCATAAGGSAVAAAAAAAAAQTDGRLGSPSSRRPDQSGDIVLKPFDVDVHMTRPGASGTAAAAVGTVASEFHVAQGWHAGVYVDELYLRFGPLHVRSLELLAGIFLPAVAAAELTAVELARGRRARGMASVTPDQLDRRVDDLVTLERVECLEDAGDASAAEPGPGQAVFFGIGRPREGSREEGGGSTAGSETSEGKDEEAKDDEGWVHCCEWRYWGLRRVAQIALPYAPLRGSVALLDGLVLDFLEVELSFVDPLTETYKVCRALRERQGCPWYTGYTRKL